MTKLALLSNIEKAINGLWDKAVGVFATKGEVAKKAEKVHTHDDRYYTETEMNTKLAGKSDTNHNHNSDYYLKDEIDNELNTKANVTHLHDDKYIPLNKGFIGMSDPGLGIPLFTDFNNVLEAGNYIVSEFSTIPNAPKINNMGGIMEVIPAHPNGSMLIQRLTTTFGDICIRHSININGMQQFTPWSIQYNTGNKRPSWNDIAEKPSTFEPAYHNHDDRYFRLTSEYVNDFNNNKTPGLFRVGGVDITNAPLKGNIYGILEVFIRATNMVIQRFTQTTGAEYIRSFSNSTWTEWTKVFSTAQKPTWDEIDDKPSTFEPASHDHDGLYYTEDEMNTMLAEKANSNHDHNGAYYKKTEVDSQLNMKADLSHRHDEIYYTQVEMNTKLAAKADAIHNHDTSYYKKYEIDSKLDSKASTTHNHDNVYLNLNKGIVTNFNTVLTKGVYYTASSTSVANAPHTGAIYGILEVIPLSTGGNLFQRLTTTVNKIYTRYYDNQNKEFSGWVPIYNGSIKPTWDIINGKPSTFTPATHNHDDLYYTETEINTKLAAKADATHNHDSAYYKKTEVDTKVNAKANASHTHDDRYFRISAGSVEDFNNNKTPGLFNVGATDIPNAPLKGSVYGTLEVLIRSSNVVIQRFTQTTGAEYIRYFSGTWTAWTKVFSTAQKPTWGDIDGKPSTFAPSSHTHDGLYYTEAEVNTKLAAKADATHNHDTAYYKKAEVDTKINAKANASHTHDDRYFTESEITTKLAAKADATHNHDTAYYKKAEVDTKINAKANTSHTHDERYHRVNLPVISEGVDINGYYTANGTYNVSASTTVVNAPYTGPIYGKLSIFIRSTGDVIQRFTSTNGKEYVRNRSGSTGGAWSAWTKVFSSAQKPTWGEIDGKPSTFTPSTHTHDDRYFTESEITNKLATKADTSHNHDTAYYKKAEVDTKLNGKASSSHTHNYLPSGVTITKEGDDFYINY